MMVDLEHFPTSETANEMLESVTKGWYERAYVGKWLYQVMGLSLDLVRQIFEELPEQFFVETATWGLAYHEQKYGLPVRENVDYEDRRRAILERMKSRVPMTPYYMEQLIKRQLGLAAEVSDVHDSGSLGYVPEHPNVFQVVIWEHDQNTVLDYGAVERLIRQVNQSHTVFSLEQRQVLNRQVALHAGALVTEFVEYEIRPRAIGRDIFCTAHAGAAAIIDLLILEEVQIGGMNDAVQ